MPPVQESSEVINGIEVAAYPGDALDEGSLRQQHYDLVLSNSVIGHVGNLRAQQHMANMV